MVDNSPFGFVPEFVKLRIGRFSPKSGMPSIDKANLRLLPKPFINLPAEVTGKRARTSLGPNHLGKLVGDEVEIPLRLPDATRLTQESGDSLLDGMKQMGRFIRKLGSHIFGIGIVCLFVNPE